MVQMVREGSAGGNPPNSTDFMAELGVSRRTVARDLDFLRDEERAPLAYDDARHGFRLTDETYTLPPVRISRKEAFSFGLARKLLSHYDGTPLHMDMQSVLDKIAESLEGDITIEPDWLSEHVGVLPEDRVRIDPDVWAQLAGCVERREAIRATYQTFDGRISEYELHPYHLLAYHGNWYVLARHVAKDRVATFAIFDYGISMRMMSKPNKLNYHASRTRPCRTGYMRPRARAARHIRFPLPISALPQPECANILCAGAPDRSPARRSARLYPAGQTSPCRSPRRRRLSGGSVPAGRVPFSSLQSPAGFPKDIHGGRGYAPQIIRADVQEVVHAAVV